MICRPRVWSLDSIFSVQLKLIVAITTCGRSSIAGHWQGLCRGGHHEQDPLNVPHFAILRQLVCSLNLDTRSLILRIFALIYICVCVVSNMVKRWSFIVIQCFCLFVCFLFFKFKLLEGAMVWLSLKKTPVSSFLTLFTHSWTLFLINSFTRDFTHLSTR